MLCGCSQSYVIALWSRLQTHELAYRACVLCALRKRMNGNFDQFLKTEKFNYVCVCEDGRMDESRVTSINYLIIPF